MSNTTPNLGLFKYNPATDGNSTFDIVQALNGPLDKIDAALPLQSMYRQSVMNGNFDVWQRGATVNFAPIGATYNVATFGPDRYWGQVFSGSNTGNAASFERQAFAQGQSQVPNNPKFYARFNISTLAALPASGGIIRMLHRIEHASTLSGQKATLSFWAKANAPRAVSVILGQSFGSGGSPSASVDIAGHVTTLNLTTAWQQFVIRFTIPSIAGKTLGTNNDDHLGMTFILYKQDNGSMSTPSGVVGTWATGMFDFAQMQLCAGDVALPFQPRSFAEELALCQRYYEKSADQDQAVSTGTRVNLAAWQISNNKVSTGLTYKVPKRTASHTVTLYDSSGVAGSATWIQHGGSAVSLATTANGVSENGFYVGSTAADSTPITNVSFSFAADAEI